MTYRFATVITKEGTWYVARAMELGVVSQGKTRKKAEANLQEAVELFLEDSGTRMPRRATRTHRPIVTTLEVEYA